MATTSPKLLVKEVLQSLDLGSSVAEFDKSLEKYFVENEAFHALVNNKADVVAGDKGTGKTAVYKILQTRYGTLPELKDVEVISGFNPAGNPIFQRLVQEKTLTEGQYVSVWKTYILSLVGNWILEFAEDNFSEKFKALSQLLTDTNLRSKDDKPETIFNKIINSIQRVLHPQSAEVECTLSETGIPIIIPRIKFGAEGGVVLKEVRHEQALRLLNDCLNELGFTVWLVLDRLDEAFQGFPDVEVPALRALLRTYLDTQEFSRVRVKLFVRRDLFRKIIGDGFVNLTHINARKREIVWDEGDLKNLLARRIKDNKMFLNAVEGQTFSDDQLFYRIFPAKVDQAERKPTTWNWIMSRVRDGKGVTPPRNLIDLVNLAREEQIRAEARNPLRLEEGVSLINAESLKSAHERLSFQRVEDTLLAEAGSATAALIENFREKRAEHNLETLSATLKLKGTALQSAIRQLVEVGFLEPLPSSWKVPMLYRAGLKVTQGKAFAPGETSDADE